MFTRLLACCLLAFALSNCVHFGSKGLDDGANYVGLQPGVTTKATVVDKFGQPADVIYRDATPPAPCTWVYFQADMGPSGWTFVPFVGVVFAGGSEDNVTTKIDFDGKERLAKVTTEKDTSYTNSWLGLTRDAYRRSKDPKAARVKAEMDRLGKPFDDKFAKNMGERRWE